jgi:hypothetical protein
MPQRGCSLMKLKEIADILNAEILTGGRIPDLIYARPVARI